MDGSGGQCHGGAILSSRRKGEMVRPRERETTDEGEKEESTEGVMGEGKRRQKIGVLVQEEGEEAWLGCL